VVCVVPPEQHSSWIGYKEKRRWHPNEKERVKLRKNERCEVRYGSLAGKCRDCKGDRGLAGVPGFQAEASDRSKFFAKHLSCLRVLAYLRWVSSSQLPHLLHKGTPTMSLFGGIFYDQMFLHHLHEQQRHSETHLTIIAPRLHVSPALET